MIDSHTGENWMNEYGTFLNNICYEYEYENDSDNLSQNIDFNKITSQQNMLAILIEINNNKQRFWIFSIIDWFQSLHNEPIIHTYLYSVSAHDWKKNGILN